MANTVKEHASCKKEGLSEIVLKDLLTVVITTSPAKCHPAVEMIRDVIESFSVVDGLSHCDRIVVCDGVKVGLKERPSRGIVSSDTQARYLAYINNLKKATGLSIKHLICAEERIGFGFGVKRSLEFVKTPYVMVVHHDQKYTRNWCISNIVNAMQASEIDDKHPPVHYVGCLSKATFNYHSSCLGKGLPDPRDGVIKLGSDESEKLVPLYVWYDRNHIANVEHYKNVVFAENSGVKRGTFIEDCFGQAQLSAIKEGGLQTHRAYGTYLFDDGMGPAISHIDGRRWMTEGQRKELGLPPLMLTRSPQYK